MMHQVNICLPASAPPPAGPLLSSTTLPKPPWQLHCCGCSCAGPMQAAQPAAFHPFSPGPERPGLPHPRGPGAAAAHATAAAHRRPVSIGEEVGARAGWSPHSPDLLTPASKGIITNSTSSAPQRCFAPDIPWL